MANSTAKGHLAALVTILIWGTTFISTKVLLVDFQPIEILFFRFLMGLLALMIVYPHRLKGTTIKQESVFVAAGLCGVCLYYLLENIALTYTIASNVGVIISVAPFFTAILSHLFLKQDEKLRANFFIGFIVAMLGIGLISFGYNTILTTRRVFFYGILFMIPALFLFDFELDLSRFANMTYLLNILFLGLGASALCFVTWNFAVKILGAVKTSICIYLVPVITVAASVLIIHEPFTWITGIGTILTLAALHISEI
mgnify:CR=1 FL=1